MLALERCWLLRLCCGCFEAAWLCVCVCVFSHSCVHSGEEGGGTDLPVSCFSFRAFSVHLQSVLNRTLEYFLSLSLSLSLSSAFSYFFFYPPSVSRSPNLFPRLISNSLLIPDLILSPPIPFFSLNRPLSSHCISSPAHRCLLLVNYIPASTQTGNSWGAALSCLFSCQFLRRLNPKKQKPPANLCTEPHGGTSQAWQAWSRGSRLAGCVVFTSSEGL